MTARFVCLANSSKEGGRCIAGIELDNDNNPVIFNGRPKWIRPVCDTVHGEIPIPVAEPFQLLDIIQVDEAFPKPQGYQSENIIFKTESIKKVGVFQADRLNELCDSTQHLFINRIDALTDEEISNLDHSLLLIKPRVFKVVERINPNNHEQTKHRLAFSYNGCMYDFSITDLAFLKKYQKSAEFFERITEIFLLLSVGVKFPVTNKYYKLVAGIIY